ncbi:hypothetical protein BASA50_001364 [Batrachochytrium salamandrivorans]|uniref:F-actin-capping protein subunit alpha n=1 Tax=Batrachochytrium salamandrivorans TaxID=1357716 RepID=A0ABQ8EVC0_9FUNG|nr:hypothetical protein BASA62_003503 [Batrachochytrium salamandrivorans]KAH6587231.1 hypothetical protein BASA50_001364 [Batrachochytrium salamandrivorans]
MTTSDADKLEIVTGFIKDSPPGEINDVFNDVRSLLGDDALLQTVVDSTLADHHAQQFISVKVPNKDYEVILGKHGLVGTNSYIDPRSGQLLTVDLVHQTVQKAEPFDSKSPAHLLEQRAALDSAIEEYTSSFYPSSVSTVWIANDDSLVVAIVANKYHPDSFWSGRWRSQWTIHPSSSLLTGFAKVQVHYYEDGNVQHNSVKEYSFTINTSDDPATLAATVVKHISKTEAEYQTTLNDGHAHFASETFKSLRRALPVSRTKIEWQGILSYKIGSELVSK